jgi:hypothetical protein
MKKVSMVLLAGLLFLGIFELAAGLFFTSQKDKFTFHSDQMYLLRDDRLGNVQHNFDRALGWKTVYPTKYGERPRQVEYPTDLLAAFGDSFTHGDEVAPEETWQSYLSEQVGSNVYNLGNGAYGTDQAYLRFTQDYPRIKTRIVTLGLITENINRVASVYRAFTFPGTGMPATKPRFALKGGDLELIANPVQMVSEVARLKDPDFIRKIGQDDYWYTHQRAPRLGFPYTKILFSRFFWQEVRLRLGHASRNELAADADLWQGTEYEQIMYRLFDRFSREAKGLGGVPVVMIFPMKQEAAYALARQAAPPAVAKINAYCAQQGILVFDGVAALARNAKSVPDLQAMYRVEHLSPQGNRIIAAEFHQFLTQHKLL